MPQKRTTKKLLHQLHLPLPSDLDDSDGGDYDEIDLQVGYRRPEPVQYKVPYDDDEPLSDYVTVRLAVARARAMARYRELRT